MKLVCHATEEAPRVIRSVTLKGFASADSRWSLGSARTVFNAAWREALQFELGQLIHDANAADSGLDSNENYLQDIVRETMRKKGREVQEAKPPRYPLPYDMTIEQRNDGFFVFSKMHDGRMAGSLQQDQADTACLVSYSKKPPQSFLDNRARVIGDTPTGLEATRTFYFLWSYWQMARLVEAKMDHLAILEENEKQRAAFHDNLMMLVRQMMMYRMELRLGGNVNDSSFVKQLSHILALGFNHPENPMPYMVYNARYRDDLLKEALPLPSKIGG